MPFEQFFKWLLGHRNCLTRIEAGPVTLADNELLHWDMFDEGEASVIQLIQGKTLVAEIMIERGEVQFVQASPDLEEPNSGQWVFECIGGTPEQTFPMFAFIMTHGIEQSQGHQALKH